MREIVRTNDAVLVSAIGALLAHRHGVADGALDAVVRMHELARPGHVLERGQERIALREVVVAEHVAVHPELARVPAEVLDERVIAQRKLVRDHASAAAALGRVHEERHAAERRADQPPPGEVDAAQILAPGHAPTPRSW